MENLKTIEEEKQSVSQELDNSQERQLIKTEEDKFVDLTPKMHRFVNLYLTGQYSVNKLGQLLESHPNTLFKWLRRKDVKALISEMQGETHEMVNTQLS